MNDAIKQLFEALRLEAAESVTLLDDALGFEFFASSGRMIPIIAETTVTDRFKLSDAGETWNELVSDGYTKFRPSYSNAKRLERLASMYDVGWNSRTGAFETHATVADAAAAARRLLSASIALDAWRVWAEVAPARAIAPRELVKRVQTMARGYGWDETSIGQKLPGEKTRHEYATDLVLTKGVRKAAISSVPGSPEFVMRTAVCWMTDVQVPVVLITSPRTAEQVADHQELRGRAVAVVGRAGAETAPKVLEQAERVTKLVA